MNGEVKIIHPSTAKISMWNGRLSYLKAGATVAVFVDFTGMWNTSGAIDGFQIQFNTGNITSGTVYVYGIP